MRKINKIVLSVSCVGVAMLLFYLGQQKSMIKSIISDNVEALVNDEWIGANGWTFTYLHTKSAEGYTDFQGFYSRYPMSGTGNEYYVCGTKGWANKKRIGECVYSVN